MPRIFRRGSNASASFITTASESSLFNETVLGTGVIMAGTFAARPAASLNGRLYLATDLGALYRDSGAVWQIIGHQPIATTTLGAPAASISFTGIPTDYTNLTIFLEGRGDTAATQVPVQLRFNNDVAANYDSEAGSAFGGTPTATETLAATSIFVGSIAANTAPAGAGDQLVVDVANYKNATLQKSLTGLASSKRANTAGNIGIFYMGGWWRSTAAINRIDLFPTAGNFIAGTVATIYGVP